MYYILRSCVSVTRLIVLLGVFDTMPNVHQIQEKLAAWTDHDISLAEFEDWFVPATWNIHKSGDKAAEDLVNEIELNLSEHYDGHMSDEELRAAMLVASFNAG